MMKEEFFERLTDEAKTRFDDDQYETIEFVYVWHPALHGKDDIAAIYNLPCGFRLIKDMVATAKQAESIERRAQELRSQRDEIQRQLDALQRELNQLAS